jgi:hypothetical protein
MSSKTSPIDETGIIGNHLVTESGKLLLPSRLGDSIGGANIPSNHQSVSWQDTRIWEVNPDESRQRVLSRLFSSPVSWALSPNIGSYSVAKPSDRRLPMVNLPQRDLTGQSLPDLVRCRGELLETHTRPFCTINMRVARVFVKPGRRSSGGCPDEASWTPSGKTPRTKKRIGAYPSDAEISF